MLSNAVCSYIPFSYTYSPQKLQIYKRNIRNVSDIFPTLETHETEYTVTDFRDKGHEPKNSMENSFRKEFGEMTDRNSALQCDQADRIHFLLSFSVATLGVLAELFPTTPAPDERAASTRLQQSDVLESTEPGTSLRPRAPRKQASRALFAQIRVRTAPVCGMHRAGRWIEGTAVFRTSPREIWRMIQTFSIHRHR